MESIAAARRVGYQTVIAPQGFEVGAGTSAHTGKYTIDTQAGKVTVLSAQRELSNLARGNPSSTRATGEQTQAGQTARFMAQSAFYQMEQPYAERSLLVCFDADQDTQQADRIMTELEHAPWIHLEPMDNLMRAPDFTGGSSGLLKALEADDGQDGAKHGDSSTATLDSLIASGRTSTGSPPPFWPTVSRPPSPPPAPRPARPTARPWPDRMLTPPPASPRIHTSG